MKLQIISTAIYFVLVILMSYSFRYFTGHRIDLTSSLFGMLVMFLAQIRHDINKN